MSSSPIEHLGPRLLVKALHETAAPDVRWDLVANMGTKRKRTRNGRTTFYLDFRPFGRVWAHQGVPIADERTAERLLQKIRARVAEGRALESVLADYVGGDSGPNMVAPWLDTWLEEMEKKAAAGKRSPTYLEALQSYRRGAFQWWKGRTVHEIKKGTLVAWLAWLEGERGYHWKTAINILGAFRRFTRWLVEDREVLPRMPAFPTVERGADHTPTIISVETQDAILQEIPQARRGPYLALALGLRPGEVRAMNVTDYREGWLMVAKAVKGDQAKAPIRETKTKQSRRIPVSPELREWIEQRMRGEANLAAPLFPNPVAKNKAGRWTAGQLRTVWKRACNAVGVKVGLYEGLKHSSATALLTNGAPMEWVQKLLGHKDRRSTERYARLGDFALVKALDLRRRPEPRGSSTGAS